MIIVRLLPATAVALSLSVAATGQPLPPSPARLDDIAARPLRAADLEISVAVPRLDDIEGHMARRTFDLRDRAGVAALKDALGALSRLAEMQHDYRDSHRERILPFRYDLSSAGKRRALREMIALADRLLQPDTDGSARDQTMRQLLELHHAIENSFRYPIKKSYEIIPEVLPLLLIKMRQHQGVEKGSGGEVAAEPAPSSFWSPRADLAAQDLYAGFGRRARPVHDEVCEYAEAKTGWGAHPGFEVKCGGTKLEFKLGDEIYGGPFNTRVFDALGYHTFAIDGLDALKLRYDRRVLTEYNSRRYLSMRATVLLIPVFKHVVTKIEDPFTRITAAVLSDGRRISGAELKRALLKDPALHKGRPRPETVASNYDEAFERQIAYLVWEPGTVAYEPDTIRAIGAWDYDQLGHADRREVRAVFALAAWLDQYNMRWENTRLAYVEEDGQWWLRHLFSDVGSGLSDAHSMAKSTNSDVEGMLWEVTTKGGDGTVKFSGFAVNVRNDAFDAMTAEDARWMVRRLSALSEPQILQGLLATSMSAAEVRLALEKLLSKRQKMVADFGLSAEFPEIAGRRIDRALDFDPRRPEDMRAVTLRLPDGTTVAPPAGDWALRGGHLVRRGAPETKRPGGATRTPPGR